ncbi:MAG: VOC family protein [Formosimonas sp.]
MQQAVSYLTIGAHDLTAMRHFYVNVFGWTPCKDSDSMVLFQLDGLRLALYPADALADEIGIVNDGQGFKRMSLAMNFASAAQVDAAFAQLTRQGARAVKSPESVFWGGYRGYVADVEDNYWELCFNPFLTG